MITIIHGTDIAQSRKFFLDIKQKNPDNLIMDGKNVTLTDLAQIFEGGELFSEKKNFFIEGLLGKKKKSKELDSLMDYIKKVEADNSIYIWEGSELTKTHLATFNNPIIKLFKLPMSLFTFLESVKPGNGKQLLRLFHETITSSDAEMVFFMMIRQIRLLIALAEPTNNPIDETIRMSPWQKTKLQNQADFFEIKELIKFYDKLFEIDKAMKTGNLTGSLPQTIDFLLLQI